jgi:hypothetical protein
MSNTRDNEKLPQTLRVCKWVNKKKIFSSNLFVPHRLFMIMYVILVIKIEYKNSFCISIPK